MEEMRRVRVAGTLTQAEAASLCGKLGFVRMWTWGRFGRAVLQPLMRRQADKWGMRVELGAARRGGPGFSHVCSAAAAEKGAAGSPRSSPDGEDLDGRDVGGQFRGPGESGSGRLLPAPPHVRLRMECGAVRACVLASAPRGAGGVCAEYTVHWAAQAAGSSGGVLHVRPGAERQA
eukprot:3754476-Pleurochrysis_carterae.AAC.1